MLGNVTTTSTFGSSYYQAVDSVLGLKSSTEYLINTANILKMKSWSTDDSYLLYKLNLNEDSSPEFILIVDETNAAINTLDQATAESDFIYLEVYDGAITFNDLSDLSTTTTQFRVQDIVWGNENNAGTDTRIWVCEGGFALRSFFVSESIDQIIDLADTGTTTTTTSSTSSTSSSSTSTTTTTTTETPA